MTFPPLKFLGRQLYDGGIRRISAKVVKHFLFSIINKGSIYTLVILAVTLAAQTLVEYLAASQLKGIGSGLTAIIMLMSHKKSIRSPIYNRSLDII